VVEAEQELSERLGAASRAKDIYLLCGNAGTGAGHLPGMGCQPSCGQVRAQSRMGVDVMTQPYQSELIKPSTLAQMVEAYAIAVDNIEVHYRALALAEKQLEEAFMGSDRYSAHMNIVYGRYWEWKDPEVFIEEMKLKIRKSAWSKVIDHIGAKNFLTTERIEKMQDNIEDGKIPEFTLPNVMQVLLELRQELPGLVDEVCKDAFGILTPGKYRDNKLKTNSGFRIGAKVILKGYVYEWGVGGVAKFHVQQGGYETRLMTIEKAFRLLDGKGVPKDYRSDIASMIWSNPEDSGETEYFKYKAYRNGNLHLEFRRIDLVRKINLIGNDSKSLGAGDGY